MEDKLEKIFNELISNLDIEIIYVDFEKEGGYNYLRVYIEKDDSTKVSLDDCEKVSLLISDEAEKNISQAFMLEVSSPGLERKLKREKDFLKYMNERIKVRTFNNVEGSKKFEGKLLSYKSGIIEINDDKLGLVSIPLEKIKIAKNIYDFSSILNGGKIDAN